MINNLLQVPKVVRTPGGPQVPSTCLGLRKRLENSAMNCARQACLNAYGGGYWGDMICSVKCQSGNVTWFLQVVRAILLPDLPDNFWQFSILTCANTLHTMCFRGIGHVHLDCVPLGSPAVPFWFTFFTCLYSNGQFCVSNGTQKKTKNKSKTRLTSNPE